jgi:hypothetical protein
VFRWYVEGSTGCLKAFHAQEPHLSSQLIDWLLPWKISRSSSLGIPLRITNWNRPIYNMPAIANVLRNGSRNLSVPLWRAYTCICQLLGVAQIMRGIGLGSCLRRGLVGKLVMLKQWLTPHTEVDRVFKWRLCGTSPDIPSSFNSSSSRFVSLSNQSKTPTISHPTAPNPTKMAPKIAIVYVRGPQPSLTLIITNW